MKYGVDDLLSGNHGDDIDLDFKVILGPSVDGEWQPDEEDNAGETGTASGSEVILIFSLRNYKFVTKFCHLIKYEQEFGYTRIKSLMQLVSLPMLNIVKPYIGKWFNPIF